MTRRGTRCSLSPGRYRSGTAKYEHRSSTLVLILSNHATILFLGNGRCYSYESRYIKNTTKYSVLFPKWWPPIAEYSLLSQPRYSATRTPELTAARCRGPAGRAGAPAAPSLRGLLRGAVCSAHSAYRWIDRPALTRTATARNAQHTAAAQAPPPPAPGVSSSAGAEETARLAGGVVRAGESRSGFVWGFRASLFEVGGPLRWGGVGVWGGEHGNAQPRPVGFTPA